MWRIIVFASMLIPSVRALGQNFGGGVHVGLISSHVLESTVPAQYNKVGLWAGGFTDYRFTPKSTLQLELSFIQKGFRQAGNLDNNNVDKGMNLNYLEIPILYRWWGIKNMSIEIGPQMGVLLSHREWDQFGDIEGGNPNYKDFSRFELSAAAGLSYFFLKGRLEVNARYAISAIPIRVRAQGEAIWPLARQYNSMFGFSVRWWFKNTKETFSPREKSVRTLE